MRTKTIGGSFIGLIVLAGTMALSSGGLDHLPTIKTPSSQSVHVEKTSLPSGLKATGGGSYYVNDNKSTLNAKITSAPYAQFSNQDSLGRPQVANAWLNHSSRIYQTRDKTGNSATIKPVGYHQAKVDNTWVYNRGHLLGYAIIGGLKSVDASEANPKNIITQTSWANQSNSSSADGQNYYESLVRKALDNNKLVRYQVKPYYQGSELVARGVYMQAKSSDGSLNFNVYVPNVQPNVTINYATGYVK